MGEDAETFGVYLDEQEESRAMSKTIHKYQLDIEDECRGMMQRGARLLTAAMQNGALMVWAEVRPDEPKVTRVFYIRGTGHPMGAAAGRPHVGTVFIRDLVFHVFDGGETT
jgi:hypothetical protein